MKIHTIGMYGIIFSETKQPEVNYSNVLYSGRLKDLPEAVAQKVAELDERCLSYFDDAMATLWKTYRPKGGSESARHAIGTKKTKKEQDFEYIIIWRILDQSRVEQAAQLLLDDLSENGFDIQSTLQYHADVIANLFSRVEAKMNELSNKNKQS